MWLRCRVSVVVLVTSLYSSFRNTHYIIDCLCIVGVDTHVLPTSFHHFNIKCSCNVFSVDETFCRTCVHTEIFETNLVYSDYFLLEETKQNKILLGEQIRC